jgi:hypothetical protein
MSKYYTYRWGSGCESALIEGPGLGDGMEVTDLMDRELAATCERMDKAYEAGLHEGAGLNEAVAEVVAPKPGLNFGEATFSSSADASSRGYRELYMPANDDQGWLDAVHRIPPMKEHLEHSRGLGKTLAQRIKYMEELMVRSLFHEVTGELPTDEAMQARIVVERYHDKSYAYVLDRKVQGYPHGGTLLLMREASLPDATRPRNLARTLFSSPLFAH